MALPHIRLAFLAFHSGGAVSDSRTCAANPGCVAVGLTGNNNCCPTDDGMQLGCCGVPSPSPPVPDVPSNLTVLSHCGSGDQYGWPSFDNEASLRANKPWADYFQAVYGEVPSSGFPICTLTLSHLYKPALEYAGVVLPAMTTHCPTSTGQYYATMTDHQESWSSWIWNWNLAQPASGDLPGHTWVEVIHQRFFWDLSATWLYYAPGTAIWLNLGNTLAYDNHGGAVEDLLQRPCSDNEQQCATDFIGLQLVGIARGINTIQFRRHADMMCDYENIERRNMGIEIMDLGGPGEFTCGQISSGQSRRYRAGWEAASQCDCDNKPRTLNCAGFGNRSAVLQQAMGESIEEMAV